MMRQEQSMEQVILQDLAGKFPTPMSQHEELVRLVNEFGSLAEQVAKFSVPDILCLAMMLYRTGNTRILRDIQRRILDLQDAHEGDRNYIQKLEILNKCLTNFKPAIFRNIEEYFAQKYQLPIELIKCLPKIQGQQIGAKVIIKRAPEDQNPIFFYVKAHQEFCSKSHPQFISATSDKTGHVNIKELFLYKVLEYIGYGPKTHFIIDRNIAQSRVEEGIMIATQELGYTKRPQQIRKSFKIFGELRERLQAQPIGSIDASTKRDIIAIDILSRAFLLADVMINQGNFGRVDSCVLGGSPDAPSKCKWKIIDFTAPELRADSANGYIYERYYQRGVDIFHSFQVGNSSHCYQRDGLEIICHILSEGNARDFWLSAINRLSHPETESSHHMPVIAALGRAFSDIEAFLRDNAGILQIKSERLASRMEDLNAYKIAIEQNFMRLAQGIRDYIAASPAVAASTGATPPRS